MRTASVDYLTASYLTDVIKGLTCSYNLLNRLSLAPITRAKLNEDSLTSYILQDEAMQEAEQPSELCAQSGGSGSSGWKPTKDADKKKLAKDSGRGGGSRRRERWLCGDPNHLSFECHNRSDSDDVDTKVGRWRSGSRRPRRGRCYVMLSFAFTSVCLPSYVRVQTLGGSADSSAGGKGRDDKEASCSLVGVMEPTVSLAPEAGEDFQAMTAAAQANPAVVLLVSGCPHHLMGTKEVFVDLQPSGDVKHMRGFNGVLQNIHGRGTVPLQGEAGRQVLIPDVLYVLAVRANLLSAGQLKENGVKLQEDGNGMLLVSAAGDILGPATYTRPFLCTDLHPCLAKSTTPTTEVVTLRAIVLVTKSTPDRLHARLAHVGMNTIWRLAKHKVATRLDLKSASGADLPCVLCIGGKLARHTFPDQGSDTDDVLGVVHVDLCKPFQPGTMPYQLLTGKKPNLSLARVWGCMAHFLVPEQQRGGKLKPKARCGLHLSVSEESKGWELLDIVDNRVVTTSDVVLYENMSLEVWKSEHGPASRRTPTTPPMDTSTATLPLLAEVSEPTAEDVEDVPSPSPSPAPRAPPLVADLRGLTPVSASGDEGRSGASPVVLAKTIANG
ncbi:unnamed protein product [Closterium sp. NIES-54]